MVSEENEKSIEAMGIRSDQGLNTDPLTPAEKSEKQKEQAEEWARIRLSTDPAKRSEAEIGIKKLYASLGLAEPEIVWCGSPMTLGLVQAFLVMQGKITYGTLRYEINRLIGQKVLNSSWSRGRAGGEAGGDAVFKLNQFEDALYRHLSPYTDDFEDKFYGIAWNIANPGSDWYKFLPEEQARLKEEADHAFRENMEFLGTREIIWDLGSRLEEILAERADLEGLRAIGNTAGWIIPIKQVCLIAERPSSIVFDEFMRLHGDKGPAIEFSDAWKIYMWQGMSVPAWIIEEPHTITVEDIEEEINVEQRRVMIQRYGASRYLADCGASEVHRDQFGVLYRKERSDEEHDDEQDEDHPDENYDVPLLFVKVINGTAENDGSRKEYFLRVPPTMKTAREAVAWTFGLDAVEYEPTEES